MFYGDMADKNKYIRIPDVAPIGFENLLRYAYTDSLNLNSVEDAMLTAYAAKKYLLPQLLRECLTFIEHNIGPSTACVVFEFAHVLNSQQLVLQSMNLIDRQTVNVIQSKTFNHVQASTVEFVANRKYLSIQSEYQLFSAVLGWSMSEAKRRCLDPTDWLAIRSIMNESSVLSAFRFLAMSHEEFARVVSKTSSCIVVDTMRQSLSSEPQGDVQMGDSGGEEKPMGAGGNQENQQQQQQLVKMVNVDDVNSLLTEAEQRAVFMNLTLRHSAKLPPTLNGSYDIRQAPPEYFSLKRFKTHAAGSLVTTTTTTRNLKTISSKFQCLSENVFIVALTVPIRLDASSYANRTPKFECHLKFTTKTTNISTSSSSGGLKSPINGLNESNGSPAGATTTTTATTGGGAGDSMNGHQSAGSSPSQLLMDTIDESLHISIARDRDCLVRLKRPILIRMGNINELQLTFQTYALDEDIVALRTPKLRAANFSELTDSENTSWLFFKTPNVEFNEIHYYY